MNPDDLSNGDANSATPPHGYTSDPTSGYASGGGGHHPETGSGYSGMNTAAQAVQSNIDAGNTGAGGASGDAGKWTPVGDLGVPSVGGGVPDNPNTFAYKYAGGENSKGSPTDGGVLTPGFDPMPKKESSDTPYEKIGSRGSFIN